MSVELLWVESLQPSSEGIVPLASVDVRVVRGGGRLRDESKECLETPRAHNLFNNQTVEEVI